MPALLAGDASDTPSTVARGRKNWEACLDAPSDVCGACAVDCWNVLPADDAGSADAWLSGRLDCFVAACSSCISLSICFVTDL